MSIVFLGSSRFRRVTFEPMQVHASEARAISMHQSAAAAAVALAAAEAAEVARQEHQARILNARRTKARNAAEQDRQSFLNAIYMAARLGKTSTYFGAVQEDDELYWNFVADDLQELGYDVDIRFIEERRQFKTNSFAPGNDLRASHAVELVDVNLTRYYERHGTTSRWCCVYEPEDMYTQRNYLRQVNASVEEISVWRCGILEFLWALTIIGPMIAGCWRMFGCFACVRDNARTRVTCNAPYRKNFWYGPGYQVGAIWYVRVSWDRPRTSTTSTTSTTVPEKEIPVAVPIDDAIRPFEPVRPAIIRASLE